MLKCGTYIAAQPCSSQHTRPNLPMLCRAVQGDHGSPQAPMDSEDSEELALGGLGSWGGHKALPSLGGGLAGGGPAAAAAALGLQLLSEDSGGSGGASPAGSPSPAARSRLGGVSGAGEDDLDGGGRAVRFAGATTIPAHRPEGGGPPRPSSARRTTGSGNALLKKAAGGSGSGGSAGAADVLVVEAPAVAAGRRSWLGTGGDNF